MAALATKAKLSSCDREWTGHKPKIFTMWPFTEKVCWPLLCAHKHLAHTSTNTNPAIRSAPVKQCSPLSLPTNTRLLWAKASSSS